LGRIGFFKKAAFQGGTCLRIFHGLNRFSEDLDFDLSLELKTHLNLESICKDGLKKLNKQGEKIELSKFADLKKTDTTHRARALFKLPGEKMPVSVKLEISARRLPDPGVVQKLHGIKVYSIDELARLKLLAAEENPEMPYRTAARDLHDLVFIASEYEDELADETISNLEIFFADPEALMMRYSDAYTVDSILNGRLYGDLDVIEKWNDSRGDSHNLSLFQP
jgi:predicted nucleotidyltransferase component of viral defense system